MPVKAFQMPVQSLTEDPSIKVVELAIIHLLVHDCCFHESILQNVDNTKIYKE